jgi:NTE family protein
LKPILLVLSGGGIRAMAFHAGILRFLAERGALERISNISSVSGGSLVVGLLMHLNGNRWPSSEQYLNTSLAQLRKMLTTTSLEVGICRELKKPSNWKYALSRANVLARAIENTWGIHSTLDELPTAPSWSINATTAETGKRFRFKGGELRDWVLGSAQTHGFALSDAMAVSAAFPGLIGPYVLNCSDYKWDLPIYQVNENTRPANERFKRIHLYDGGVYDNLGLEAFFDAGRGPKPDMDGTIVVSDAGAPLPTGFDLGKFNIFRLKHVADIMSDQVRSLRVRGLVAYALKVPGNAAYLRIGSTAEEFSKQFQIRCPEGDFMTKEQTAAASTFPTRLMKLTNENFDMLERHGYEAAAVGKAAFQFL